MENNSFDGEFDLYDNSDSINDDNLFEGSNIGKEDNKNEVGDYGTEDEFEANNQNSGTNKGVYIKIIITGVVIIISVLLAMNVYSSIKNKKNNTIDTKEETDVELNNKEMNSENKNVDIEEQSNGDSDTVIVNGTLTNQANSGYTEIDGNDTVNISDSTSNAKFTITFIKHYAKVQGNEMRLKTELTGNISGLSGTYELTVPYSIGTKLKIGNTFDVKIRLGEFNGNTVVDEISY